jgi:hypothetical protein
MTGLRRKTQPCKADISANSHDPVFLSDSSILLDIPNRTRPHSCLGGQTCGPTLQRFLNRFRMSNSPSRHPRGHCDAKIGILHRHYTIRTHRIYILEDSYQHRKYYAMRHFERRSVPEVRSCQCCLPILQQERCSKGWILLLAQFPICLTRILVWFRDSLA